MCPYEKAQQGLALIKSAIIEYLKTQPDGVRNADLARELGIHEGYAARHNGHISRTALECLRREGKVRQGRDKLWRLHQP
jgi:DNA-binding IclR family transcriptional regulator